MAAQRIVLTPSGQRDDRITACEESPVFWQLSPASRPVDAATRDPVAATGRRNDLSARSDDLDLD
jgi:hypothetical protein